ncbi:MAG TPA: hypothetical protein VF129_07035 [Actinomycetota bacterium]
MTVLRRRRLPPELEARRRALGELAPTLEAAKAALLDAVPGTRRPGRALAEALLEFEDGLRTVRSGMDGWRAPEVEDAWRAAAEGLETALARAERLRAEAPEPAGFEGLIGVVGDLLEPLEAFPEAAERFRRLQTR